MTNKIILVITFVSFTLIGKAQVITSDNVYLPFGSKISKDSAENLFGSTHAYEKIAYDDWCTRSVQLLEDVKIAENVYNSSVVFYANTFPNNTDEIFRRWLDELSVAGNLSKWQKDQIRVQEQLLKSMIKNEAGHKLNHLDQFMFEFLLLYLPTEQYGKLQFNKYRRMRWLEVKASNRLFQYYTQELKLSREEVSKKMTSLLKK
jgi:hypothetical protein